MKFVKIPVLAALLIILLSCDLKTRSGSPVAAEKFTPAEAFPALSFELPVELTSPEDGTNRLFVVEQQGRIQVFANKPGVKIKSAFLDIASKVKSGGEMGLLGLAFHPDYRSNGYFYVNYTRGNPLETVISRFKVSTSNPNLADPASETILLTYPQPYSNHNGGKVAFGPDKMLYIAVGDGGSGADPHNNGQNRRTLLGKILRIDVYKTEGALQYAIPGDNPFRGNTEGFREEIYAWGLRNPWRFAFDRKNGTLWAGDVGQNKIEEIDIIEKGGNYGWRVMEANELFKRDPENKATLINPIWSYPHGADGNSVTGGYVCYDKSLPTLTGKYLFGDFTSGNIWALTYSGKEAVSNELLTRLPQGGLSSFGEDTQGNLFMLALGPGKIYRLEAKK
ncbi:PQQ-dependent sugar dehydrogenase [Hufsiella ginkgonis]|uniref:Glucose sorbosone dehydrogenase n=1 Tax=Hufsiella ginkgonis TaxID=2695274 RepID=A0A7K1XSZ1_9SPHI|nr:PQQ-dependent sugar dehydrogenase [Hufsiella ginkgonis]MXV13997.1 glucose sorbosone dehydrogenase [Hufsiella ginkgonis]